MEESFIAFNAIADLLSTDYKEVERGKMMSSPGIKYKNKVFAFHFDGQMVFRLGKTFDPKTYGIAEYSYLSPFKNKPPMKGWFQIPFTENQKWEILALNALKNIQHEIDRKK